MVLKASPLLSHSQEVSGLIVIGEFLMMLMGILLLSHS